MNIVLVNKDNINNYPFIIILINLIFTHSSTLY